MIVAFLIVAVFFLPPLLFPCEHKQVFPGRDTDTGVYYFMCVRCLRVNIMHGGDGWIRREDCAKVFEEVKRRMEAEDA